MSPSCTSSFFTSLLYHSLCDLVFHFGKLLSSLFGPALVLFIHLLVLLFFSNFVYDYISLCVCFFFILGMVLSFFMSLLFLLLFVICISSWVFVMLFPFLSVCSLVFHLVVLLSFLFVHWYFFVFPTLCMIAFHCSFFFGVWCCLF